MVFAGGLLIEIRQLNWLHGSRQVMVGVFMHCHFTNSGIKCLVAFLSVEESIATKLVSYWFILSMVLNSLQNLPQDLNGNVSCNSFKILGMNPSSRITVRFWTNMISVIWSFKILRSPQILSVLWVSGLCSDHQQAYNPASREWRNGLLVSVFISFRFQACLNIGHYHQSITSKPNRLKSKQWCILDYDFLISVSAKPLFSVMLGMSHLHKQPEMVLLLSSAMNTWFVQLRCLLKLKKSLSVSNRLHLNFGS